MYECLLRWTLSPQCPVHVIEIRVQGSPELVDDLTPLTCAYTFSRIAASRLSQLSHTAQTVVMPVASNIKPIQGVSHHLYELLVRL